MATAGDEKSSSDESSKDEEEQQESEESSDDSDNDWTPTSKTLNTNRYTPPTNKRQKRRHSTGRTSCLPSTSRSFHRSLSTGNIGASSSAAGVQNILPQAAPDPPDQPVAEPIDDPPPIIQPAVSRAPRFVFKRKLVEVPAVGVPLSPPRPSLIDAPRCHGTPPRPVPVAPPEQERIVRQGGEDYTTLSQTRFIFIRKNIDVIDASPGILLDNRHVYRWRRVGRGVGKVLECSSYSASTAETCNATILIERIPDRDDVFFLSTEPHMQGCWKRQTDKIWQLEEELNIQFVSETRVRDENNFAYNRIETASAIGNSYRFICHLSSTTSFTPNPECSATLRIKTPTFPNEVRRKEILLVRNSKSGFFKKSIPHHHPAPRWSSPFIATVGQPPQTNENESMLEVEEPTELNEDDRKLLRELLGSDYETLEFIPEPMAVKRTNGDDSFLDKDAYTHKKAGTRITGNKSVASFTCTRCKENCPGLLSRVQVVGQTFWMRKRHRDDCRLAGQKVYLPLFSGKFQLTKSKRTASRRDTVDQTSLRDDTGVRIKTRDSAVTVNTHVRCWNHGCTVRYLKMDGNIENGQDWYALSERRRVGGHFHRRQHSNECKADDLVGHAYVNTPDDEGVDNVAEEENTELDLESTIVRGGESAGVKILLDLVRDRMANPIALAEEVESQDQSNTQRSSGSENNWSPRCSQDLIRINTPVPGHSDLAPPEMEELEPIETLTLLDICKILEDKLRCEIDDDSENWQKFIDDCIECNIFIKKMDFLRGALQLLPKCRVEGLELLVGFDEVYQCMQFKTHAAGRWLVKCNFPKCLQIAPILPCCLDHSKDTGMTVCILGWFEFGHEVLGSFICRRQLKNSEAELPDNWLITKILHDNKQWKAFMANRNKENIRVVFKRTWKIKDGEYRSPEATQVYVAFQAIIAWKSSIYPEKYTDFKQLHSMDLVEKSFCKILRFNGINYVTQTLDAHVAHVMKTNPMLDIADVRKEAEQVLKEMRMDIHELSGDLYGRPTETTRICRKIPGICPDETMKWSHTYEIDTKMAKPTEYDGLVKNPRPTQIIADVHRDLAKDATTIGRYMMENGEEIDYKNGVRVTWAKPDYDKAKLIESVIIGSRLMVKGTGVGVGKINKTHPVFKSDESDWKDLRTYIGSKYGRFFKVEFAKEPERFEIGVPPGLFD